MNLPKELTPQLLGLVLDEKIKEIIRVENNELHYIDSKCYDNYLNIDTLTRLMKEWCMKQDFHIETMTYDTNVDSVLDCYIIRVLQNVSSDYKEVFTDDKPTEFEAVLKATHFVAKEKGLLNE